MKRRPRLLAVLLFTALLLAFPSALLADGGPEHQTVQTRPILLGTSGGNINDISTLYCCSGTLGALVQDAAGTQYILSNNHVLARSNHGEIGDPVNQPGMIDQECQTAGVVANLTGFVPLVFSKRNAIIWNTVDAAIAEVVPGEVSTNGAILDIGTVSGNTRTATVGLAVQKSGRTTGHTTGSVQAIDVTVTVGYSQQCGGASNQLAFFQNQIEIGSGSFSDSGDSGSLIVESGSVDPVSGRPRAVGLLFAGDSSSTIACPINNVLAALGVNMVGSTTGPSAHGTITGVVTNATTGAPINGATVSAAGVSTTTDSAGAYVLENVPVGTLTVNASADGYTASSAPNVVVEENQTTVVDFQLTPAVIPTQAIPECVTYNANKKNMTVAIKVVNELGNSVAGATVNIRVDRNGSLYGNGSGATTNSSGVATYSLKNVPNGTYVTTVTGITAAGLTFAGENSTPPNSFVKGVDSVPAQFCSAGASSGSASNGAKAVTLARARAANARNSARLLGLNNVVGHGVSLAADGSPQVRVYIHRSASSNDRKAVPSTLDGVPTKLVTTDGFKAF